MSTAIETVVSPHPSDFLRCLGKYRLLRRIGRGGMSSVYLAYDTEVGQPVALKLLAEHLAYDPRFVRRFRREAHIARMVDHAHIARGLDIGEHRATGTHYLALKFIDGPCLEQVLDEQGKLPIWVAARLMADVASALAYLHSLGYLHRDVKPGNILVDPANRAQLIDFGLAVRRDEHEGDLSQESRLGTPYYMAPEQALDGRADERGDLFALGATLFHLVTGEVPYPGSNPREVTDRKWTLPPPSARQLNPALPRSFDVLLTQLLDPDPNRRPKSAQLLAARLHRFVPRSETALTLPVLPAPTRIDETNLDPLAQTQPDAVANPNPVTGSKSLRSDRNDSRTAASGLIYRMWSPPARSVLMLSLMVSLVIGSAAVLASGVFCRADDKCGTSTTTGTPPSPVQQPPVTPVESGDPPQENDLCAAMGTFVSDMPTPSARRGPPLPSGPTAIR